MGGWVAVALSQPFWSGQTKSKPWDTKVGNLVAHALGDRTALASGPTEAAWGIFTHDPDPSKDHPWYEHCNCPPSSIRPSFMINKHHYNSHLILFILYLIHLKLPLFNKFYTCSSLGII